MERNQIKLTGILDSYGWQRSNVQYQLNKHKDKPVLCIVNSLGGSVNEGLAISKLFEEHGDVVVRFVGCCASAATWMAYGAKEIEISEDSLLLVHNCSNLVSIYKSMKIEDIDKTIRELESTKKSQEAFNLTVAKKYLDRCSDKGKNLQDILDLMGEERWMTADEAVEWGFVDKVIPGINKMTDEAQNICTMNCAAMQLPVPHFAQQEDDKSLVRSLLDGLKNLVTANQPAQTEEPPKTEPAQTVNQPTKNNSGMNKNFVNIIAVLAIASNATTDEKGEITLTHDQLQTIEDALAKGKQHEQNIKDVEEVLDKVSDNIKSMDGVKNKALALTSLVNNFPISAPSGNQLPQKSDDKQLKLDECAKDEVNAEMKRFYNNRHGK